MKYKVNIPILIILVICLINISFRVNHLEFKNNLGLSYEPVRFLKNNTEKQELPFGIFVRKISDDEPIWGYQADVDKEYLFWFISYQQKGYFLINASIYTAKASITANEFNLLNTCRFWERNSYYVFSQNVKNSSNLYINKEIYQFYSPFYSNSLFQIENIRDYIKSYKIKCIVTDDRSLTTLFSSETERIDTLYYSNDLPYRFGVNEKKYFCLYLK